jgi:hypothetical protein
MVHEQMSQPAASGAIRIRCDAGRRGRVAVGVLPRLADITDAHHREVSAIRLIANCRRW